MTEAEIIDACRHYLGETLGRAPDAITPEDTFERMGLDSANSAGLIITLEDLLGRALSFDLVVQHPTLKGLAAHLADH